jgi:hypothetical protein
MTYFIYQSDPWLFVTVIALALALAIELPYRLFKRMLSSSKERADPFNALQAGILTLSAFVLSLSFSQGQARFDSRRVLVTTEASAIGTTWLRADELEQAQSKTFRHILVDYTTARIAALGAPINSDAQRQMIERSDRDRNELWNIVATTLRLHPAPGITLLMQSLNDMIDAAQRQSQAMASKVPTQVVALTLVLVTLGALSLGVRFAFAGARPVVMSAIYVAAYVVVISMMVDYDRYDSGPIKISLTPLTTQLQSMERSH